VLVLLLVLVLVLVFGFRFSVFGFRSGFRCRSAGRC